MVQYQTTPKPFNQTRTFPMEGYTLAPNFPVTAKTLALLGHLDQITIDYGDTFTSRKTDG